MGITQRRDTDQQAGQFPPYPPDDPNAISQIALAENPPTAQPSPSNSVPITGVIPKSFTEYAADPVNVAKIPDPVPAGTPMPSVVAKAMANTSAVPGLFAKSGFDTTTPSLEDALMNGPAPSLTDSTGRTFGAPPSNGYQPARTVGQPGQAGPPTPLSYGDIRRQILADQPPVIPAAPQVPHGWGLFGAGLATFADNIGAFLDHGTPTVGPGLMRNAQALQEYNRNLPVLRRQAENQTVDEGLRQMDVASQVNERIAATWKTSHPNTAPPKINFTRDGIPYSVTYGPAGQQSEYTIGDPNMPASLQPLVKGALDAHSQRLQEQAGAKAGPVFQQPALDSLNKTLTDRWQVLNPGKPLPPQYTLNAGASQSDYERTDKALEAVERATGTKAQQDSANALRAQAANLAKQNAQDRVDKQSSIPIIGFDKNGHQVFTNMGNANAAGLSEVRQVGQAEAEKVTNARGLIPVFDSKDPEEPGILQLVDKLDKAGKLGPLASRWNEFLDGKYGSGDQDFEKLRALMGLAQTGLMQVHVGARGNAFLLEHFQDMVNEKKMDAGTLKAGLQTELGYIKGKAMLANGGASSAPSGMITVQIPGQPPGHIPASARKQFLQENPGAQVME